MIAIIIMALITAKVWIHFVLVISGIRKGKEKRTKHTHTLKKKFNTNKLLVVLVYNRFQRSSYRIISLWHNKTAPIKTKTRHQKKDLVRKIPITIAV